MKEEYYQRRNVIVKRLNDMGLRCTPPEGAFYVYPNITCTGLTSTEFAHDLLREHKVAVVPGMAFSSAGEGFIRCSYATSMENIEEAMARLTKFIAK